MTRPRGIKALWRRYMAWRNAAAVIPQVEKVPNKVDGDEGDIIRHKYSNRGGGWSSGAG